MALTAAQAAVVMPVALLELAPLAATTAVLEQRAVLAEAAVLAVLVWLLLATTAALVDQAPTILRPAHR